MTRKMRRRVFVCGVVAGGVVCWSITGMLLAWANLAAERQETRRLTAELRAANVQLEGWKESRQDCLAREEAAERNLERVLGQLAECQSRAATITPAVEPPPVPEPARLASRKGCLSLW